MKKCELWLHWALAAIVAGALAGAGFAGDVPPEPPTAAKESQVGIWDDLVVHAQFTPRQQDALREILKTEQAELARWRAMPEGQKFDSLIAAWKVAPNDDSREQIRLDILRRQRAALTPIYEKHRDAIAALLTPEQQRAWLRNDMQGELQPSPNAIANYHLELSVAQKEQAEKIIAEEADNYLRSGKQVLVVGEDGVWHRHGWNLYPRVWQRVREEVLTDKQRRAVDTIK